MKKHQSVGVIAMTVAIFLAIVVVLLSQNQCANVNEVSTFTWLQYCLKLGWKYEDEDSSVPGEVAFATKYVLIGIAALFFLGFLWFTGAVPHPFKSKKSPTPD